jgi:hypothetical protein
VSRGCTLTAPNRRVTDKLRLALLALLKRTRDRAYEAAADYTSTDTTPIELYNPQYIGFRALVTCASDPRSVQLRIDALLAGNWPLLVALTNSAVETWRAKTRQGDLPDGGPNQASQARRARRKRAQFFASCGAVRKSLRALGADPAAAPPDAAARLLLFPPAAAAASPPPSDPVRNAALRSAAPASEQRKSDLRLAVEAAAAVLDEASPEQQALTRAHAWTDRVWTLARRMGRFSAAGPCGLSRDLLLAMASGNSGRAHALRTYWADVVDLVVDGRVTGPWVTDSDIVFLRKKDKDSLRPVGMGSLVRRVAGKLVAHHLTVTHRGTLESTGQFGVAEAGTGRVTRQVLHSLARGMHVLQLDMSNAFNSISRGAVLRTVQPDSPAYPLVHTLYGAPSHGRVAQAPTAVGAPPDVITISQGVVQGCPLGPILFALALEPVRDAAVRSMVEFRASRAQGRYPSPEAPGSSQPSPRRAAHDITISAADDHNTSSSDESNTLRPRDGEAATSRAAADQPPPDCAPFGLAASHPAYFDDIHCVSPDFDELLQWLSTYSEHAATVGLSFNPSKCVLLHATADPVSSRARVDLLRRVTAKDAILVMGTPVCAVQGRSPDARKALDGLWAEATSKAASRTRLIAELEHPQLMARALELACGWTRIQQKLGAAWFDQRPPTIVLKTVMDADRDVFRRVLGPFADQLDAVTWMEACLPRRLHGEGVRHVLWEAIIQGDTWGHYLDRLGEGSVEEARDLRTAADAERTAVQEAFLTALRTVLTGPAGEHLWNVAGSRATEVDAHAEREGSEPLRVATHRLRTRGGQGATGSNASLAEVPLRMAPEVASVAFAIRRGLLVAQHPHPRGTPAAEVLRYELGLAVANEHAVRTRCHHLAKLLLGATVEEEALYGVRALLEVGVSMRGDVVPARSARKGQTAPGDCAIVSPVGPAGQPSAAAADDPLNALPVAFTAVVTRGSGVTFSRVYDVGGCGTRGTAAVGTPDENDSAVRAAKYKAGPGKRDGERAHSSMRHNGTGTFAPVTFGAWGAPSIGTVRVFRELEDALRGSAKGTVSPLLSTPSMADRILQRAGYAMWSTWAAAVALLPGFKEHSTPDRTQQVREVAALVLARDADEDDLDGSVTRRRELMRAFLVDEEVDEDGVARVDCDVNVWVAAANKGRRSQGHAVRARVKVPETSPLFRLYLAIWWRSVPAAHGSSADTPARAHAVSLASRWLDSHGSALNESGAWAGQLAELTSRVQSAALQWASNLPADATLHGTECGIPRNGAPGVRDPPQAADNADASGAFASPDIPDQSTLHAIAGLADATWGLATPMKVLQQVGLRLHTAPTLTFGLPLVQELVARAKHEHAEHKQGRGTHSQATAFLREKLQPSGPIPSWRFRQPRASDDRLAGSGTIGRPQLTRSDGAHAPTRTCARATSDTSPAPATPARRCVLLSARAPPVAPVTHTTAVAAALNPTPPSTDTVVRAQHNNLPDRDQTEANGWTACATADGSSSGAPPAPATHPNGIRQPPPPRSPAPHGSVCAPGSVPTSSQLTPKDGHDPPTQS